jgi:hypothetical protein
MEVAPCVALEVPAAQALQAVLAVALQEPGAQQMPAPGLLYSPAAQGWHADTLMAPCAAKKRPAPQMAQKYVPGVT